MSGAPPGCWAIHCADEELVGLDEMFMDGAEAGNESI